MLDSTAPVVKRGKEKETPAKKKPTPLKKVCTSAILFCFRGSVCANLNQFIYELAAKWSTERSELYHLNRRQLTVIFMFTDRSGCPEKTWLNREGEEER